MRGGATGVPSSVCRPSLTTTPEPFVDEALAVVEERVLVEVALGQVDEVGAAGAGLVGQGRGGANPAGVAAHGLDDGDVDGQAADVAKQTSETLAAM